MADSQQMECLNTTSRPVFKGEVAVKIRSPSPASLVFHIPIGESTADLFCVNPACAMAPFINLFNNQLQAANVFSQTFSQNNVVTLLRGIRDNHGAYGLDQNAANVAGAFVNNQGLIRIIPTAITINNMRIQDLGAALGYLFSTQAASQQNIEDGYRPILHVYGRVLNAVNSNITMSAIMFNASTFHFFYGATIAKGSLKTTVQVDRLGQLRDALAAVGISLPPLAETVKRALSLQLADVKVPEQAGQPLRTRLPEDKLVLYDTLVTALVSGSNGTYPMTLTFASNLNPFYTARQNIINAEPTGWSQAITAALTPDANFKSYLEGILQRSVGSLFGHCAETFAFIHILRNVQQREKTQGLAMVPGKMFNLTTQQFTIGTTSYNKTHTFRLPCVNCTKVLNLAGMTAVEFNTYIDTVVRTTFDPDVQ